MGECQPNAEAHAPACSSGPPFAVHPMWAQLTLCLPHHGHSQWGPAWTLRVDHSGTFQSILLLLTIPSPCRDLPARGQRPARCHWPTCPHFPSTPLGCTGHRSHLGAFLVGLKGGLHSRSDLNDMVAGCSVQVPRSTQERCSVPGWQCGHGQSNCVPPCPPSVPLVSPATMSVARVIHAVVNATSPGKQRCFSLKSQRFSNRAIVFPCI